MTKKDLLEQVDLFEHMVWHKYTELCGHDPFQMEAKETSQAKWGNWCEENGVFLLDPALVEEYFNEKAEEYICMNNPDKDDYYFWALFPLELVRKALVLKSLP